VLYFACIEEGESRLTVQPLKQTDKQKGQPKRQTDKQMDRWTKRRLNRQT